MLYTVVGTYFDNEQRYATEVVADSPEEAEELAQAQALEDNNFDTDDDVLIIAAVIEGKVKIVA